MNRIILLTLVMITFGASPVFAVNPSITGDAMSGISGFSIGGTAAGLGANGAFVASTSPLGFAPGASNAPQMIGSTNNIIANTVVGGIFVTSNTISGAVVGAFDNGASGGSTSISAQIGGATSASNVTGNGFGVGLNNIAIGNQVSNASSIATSSVSTASTGNATSSVAATVNNCANVLGGGC